MRISVRKHYRELIVFVRLANLGWDEILRTDEFPRLHELEPEAKHRQLLERIDRSLERKFRNLRLPSDVPPLFLPGWRQYPHAWWRSLHAYALVRRVFDSISFLTSPQAARSAGAVSMPLLLQTAPARGGLVVRERDPYEEFLASLVSRDLLRVRSCPVCRRFFIAFRLDQKACSLRCANRFRVEKFRKKQPEYLRNRRFRKRTGLAAPRHGRARLLALHQALTNDLLTRGPG